MATGKEEDLVIPQGNKDWDLSGLNLALFRQLAGVEQLTDNKLHYPFPADNYRTVEQWLKKYTHHQRLMERFQNGMNSPQLPNLEKKYFLETYDEVLNQFEEIITILWAGWAKQDRREPQPLTPSDVSLADSSVRVFKQWRPFIKEHVEDIEAVLKHGQELSPRLLRQKIAQRVVTELLHEFKYQNQLYQLENGRKPKMPIHRKESREILVRAAVQTDLWNEARAKLLLEQAKEWSVSEYPLFKEVFVQFMEVWPVARGVDKQKPVFELLDIRGEALKQLQRGGIKVKEGDAVRIYG